MTVIFWIIALIVLIAVLVALAAAFYERASNAVSLVRTGIGGRRVVIDGGLLALPWFHEVTRVNMQTIRLEVDRRADQSLITRDKLRIDVGAEFYLSVPPEEASVARAAQALGRRSFQASELRELLEGIFVDALRSIAATRSMDELHEGRAEFMTRIRETVAQNVSGYGLQLDAVALTALDQTPFAALDENNAFNAEGLRKLSQVIAQSKRERAEIAQTQQVETLISAQLAEVARAKAEAERASAEARIRMEQQIQAADIAREQAIREAEILRAQALELAEQDRAISIAAKSQEESRALAEADLTRAEAVRAQEAVETARAEAEAERRRILSRISAEAEAEAAARRSEIAAASALKSADAKLQTSELEAAAQLKLQEAQISALQLRIAAENQRSSELLAHEAELARLEAMPRIVAEMVKPAEKIGNINVTQVGSVEGSRGAVLQALESVLEQTVHAPGLHRLLERVQDDIRHDDTRRRRRDRDD